MQTNLKDRLQRIIDALGIATVGTLNVSDLADPIRKLSELLAHADWALDAADEYQVIARSSNLGADELDRMRELRDRFEESRRSMLLCIHEDKVVA